MGLIFYENIGVGLFAAEHDQNLKQLDNKFRCVLVLDHSVHLDMNRKVVSCLHQQWSKTFDSLDVGNVGLLLTIQSVENVRQKVAQNFESLSLDCVQLLVHQLDSCKT